MLAVDLSSSSHPFEAGVGAEDAKIDLVDWGTLSKVVSLMQTRRACIGGMTNSPAVRPQAIIFAKLTRRSVRISIGQRSGVG
jgi:hypothetical protein